MLPQFTLTLTQFSKPLNSISPLYFCLILQSNGHKPLLRSMHKHFLDPSVVAFLFASILIAPHTHTIFYKTPSSNKTFFGLCIFIETSSNTIVSHNFLDSSNRNPSFPYSNFYIADDIISVRIV